MYIQYTHTCVCRYSTEFSTHTHTIYTHVCTYIQCRIQYICTVHTYTDILSVTHCEMFTHPAHILTGLSGLCGYIRGTAFPFLTSMTWESPTHAIVSSLFLTKAQTPVVPLFHRYRRAVRSRLSYLIQVIVIGMHVHKVILKGPPMYTK